MQIFADISIKDIQLPLRVITLRILHTTTYLTVLLNVEYKIMFNMSNFKN
jgi:hypothetical protein